MKVLFTHSYFMRFDEKQWQWKQPYPPLATILAAAVLRDRGHEVQLFDTQFAENPDEIIPVLESFKPDFLVVYDDGFNYLTKMCLTNMREAAWKMSKLASAAGCKVIVSSSDSTDHYESYLQHNADVVILGEAEETLTDLVEQFRTDESVEGIAFLREDKAVKTAARKIKSNLSDLPMPAWDLVDIESYKKQWLSRWSFFALNIATTRGCPYKCNWCAKPIYGNVYNMRSPEHVVKELKLLKEKFGVEYIWMCDDIFGLRRNWVIEFAELIEKNNLKIKYKIQSRADLLVQEKYVEALAKSGCYSVWMGAESGSQQVLDAMDKGTKVEEIEKATQLLKQHNIEPAFFLQFGYPGEEMADIQKTIKMVNTLLPEDIGVSVSYPLPGTPFYERVKSELNHKSNWSDSDDLDLMFTNKYNREFYKQLHRYIHKNYRKHQAMDIIKNLPASLNVKNLRRILSLAYFIPASYFEKKKLIQLEPEARIL